MAASDETTRLETASARPPAATRRGEIVAFVILAVVIWPILAIGTVGGFGFLVWMSQLILGPPGPPPGPPH